MNSSIPYVTPQERRRQKAVERQLPSFRPAPEAVTAETDALRLDPRPQAAPPRR
jgi:hypothetical protein